MDRRQFLKLLSFASVSLGPLSSLVGCGEPTSEDVAQAADNLTDDEKQKTLDALFDAIIPSDGPRSPGAADVGVLEAMRLENFVPSLVNLGYLHSVPQTVMDNLHRVDALLRELLLVDLSAAAIIKSGVVGRKFIELSREDQREIIGDRLEGGPLRALYDLVRAACGICFLGALGNDKGLPVIGLSRYVNFADALHCKGYDDYSYDAVPAAGGVAVWDVTIDGELPE